MSGDDEQTIPPLDMTAETARIADQLDLPTATVALHLQHREQIAALRTELAKRPGFGGLWVERDATFKVIVAFTTSTGAQAAIDSVGSTFLPDQYLVPRQVAQPLVALEAEMAGLVTQGKSKAGVAGVRSSAFEAYVDEAANEVVMDVASADQARRISASLAPSSAVRVETVPALSDPQDCTRAACDPFVLAGLATMPLCSSGFTATKNGVNGVVTAKHCGAVSHNGVSLGAPGAEAFGGAVDAEWLALPASWTDWIAILAGVPAENPFRGVKSVAAPTADYVGMPVCAAGGTTGYTCGTISSINYAPGYIPGAFGFRLATYANADGDSGGPVFVGEEAQGIHAARRIADGQSVYGHIGNAVTALGIQVNVK